jgi:hypothetical protein
MGYAVKRIGGAAGGPMSQGDACAEITRIIEGAKAGSTPPVDDR